MLFRVAWLRPRHEGAGAHGRGRRGHRRAAALQDRAGGVDVFGTASASKHEVLREHGCDHPIDYRTVDYAAEVRKLTNGQGVDLILDALGGEDWKKGYELLGPAGLLIAFGFANMASGETRNLFHVVSNFFKVPKYSPMKLMDDNKGVTGVNVGHLWGHQELLVGELKALLELYQQKKIKPVIDSTYKFEQAAEAHKRISERKNVGKVVLVP